MAQSQAHNRNDSIESNFSLSTIQSDGSVTSALSTTSSASKSLCVYEKLKGDIQRLRRIVDDNDLGKYVSRANLLISSLSASEENEIQFSGSKLKLDGVMKAMLEHTVSIESKKYVLAAILSCEAQVKGETEDQKRADVVERLKAVTETWVYYLLFIFKASPGSHKKVLVTPAEAATPTIRVTEDLCDIGLKKSRTMSEADVKRRDGYKCVITGYVDEEHHDGNDLSVDIADVQVAHILRRAVATFPRELAERAAPTFDILRNFTGLPDDIIKTLEDRADTSPMA